MFPCITLGDSIAVGIAPEIPGSPAYATAHVRRISAWLAIISLGSNDRGADTTAAMEKIRSMIDADRVVWILPSTGSRAAAVAVAARHGDRTVYVRPMVGRDGVHPRPGGYREIAPLITE